jgi:CRP/FNR family transcriptional regulator
VQKRKVSREPELFDPKLDFMKAYGQNEVIFSEGSRGREMYVVYSGKVQISKKDPAGHDAQLSILESGEIFGEMALIDASPRSATATAIEGDVELINLDRTRFMYLLRYEPEFALIVMRTLCQRIREKNAQYATLLDEAYAFDADSGRGGDC